MSKKVRMLQTTKGSPNGISIVVYEKDKDYTIPDSLAAAFVDRQKVAIEVVYSPPKEEKMVVEAPSNKSMSKVEIKPAPPVMKKPKVRLGKYRKD